MTNKAIVASISAVEEIPGADNIHVAIVLGERCIVSKEWAVGFVGVLFPAGVQLSEDFCFHNNLYRKADKNKDTSKTGFFEESRRVRAQPFLKVRSEAFFAGLGSIAWAGNIAQPSIGFEFDELNGHKICQKYYSEESLRVKGAVNKAKQAKKNYSPLFEKHVDSEQFKHNVHRIKKGSVIHIHAKVHGTSFRCAHLPVLKELPVWKQKVNGIVRHFFNKTVFEDVYEYGYVNGTRNVILKPEDTNKEGFHGSEAYRFEVLEALKPHLEKGMSVYGEIAGYVNGKPIMPPHNIKALKNKEMLKKYGETVVYKYGCKEHQYRFHIYRITMMNEAGTHIDLSQAQIDNWCEQRGLNAPVSVCEPFIYNGNAEVLGELVERLTERPECLTEDYIDPSHISEGVVLRIDSGAFTPTFMKSKSYPFRVMEGLCEAVDVESTN